MFKVLIILQLCLLQLLALDWLEFEKAQDLQKENSKIIMIDVVRSHCQYWLNEKFGLLNNYFFL